MPRPSLPLALSVAAYASAIVSANVVTARYGTVPVGFGLEVLAGTYLAGFALLARDFVHRFGGVWVAIGAVLTAGVVSYALSTPGLAVASTLAFLVAEFVDLAVFHPLRRSRGFVLAAGVSSTVSAPVDTFAFLILAGFPLTVPLVVGQLVGKILWATLVPLVVWCLVTGERVGRDRELVDA